MDGEDKMHKLLLHSAEVPLRPESKIFYYIYEYNVTDL